MLVDLLNGLLFMAALTAYGMANQSAYWIAVPLMTSGAVRIAHTSILAIVAGAVLLQHLADKRPQNASRWLRRAKRGSSVR